MEKEVKQMEAKSETTKGRGLIFTMNSMSLSEGLGRLLGRLIGFQRKVIFRGLSMSNIIECLLFGNSFWYDMINYSLLEAGRSAIYGLTHWLGYIIINVRMAIIAYRTRIRAYSVVLHVRLLQLIERSKDSADIFRSISPRHQDRGSGDAVSHHDNLRRVQPCSASAAVSALFIYI